MADLIQQFAETNHEYNGISGERRTMQVRVLRALEAQVGGDITSAGASDIQQLLISQLESGLKPTTVRKHLGAIRPFFAWARHQGIVSGDTLMDIRDLKPPRGGTNGKPRPYSRKEIRRFWASFDLAYPEGRPDTVDRFLAGRCGWRHVQKHAKRVQMLAIVSLALDGGARRDEIFNFALEDLDPDNTYVPLWGARKNPNNEALNRPVPWRGQMHEAVSAWLDLRAKLAPDHDRVWLSLHGSLNCRKPMCERTFRLLLRRIPPGWEFHRMRHTMATEYLRSNGKLHALQKILGHARIQQTLLYAELLSDDIVKDAARIESDYAETMDELRVAA